MPISIPSAVTELLKIVGALQQAYPKKPFTLDGRLVGDIGEMLAESVYDREVFERLQRHHDAKCSQGRFVQIKATMKASLTFPCDHVPDFYLGIKINADGTFDEIFNGPGSVAALAIAKRQVSKTNLHSVTLTALKRLNALVQPEDRIPRRLLRTDPTSRHEPAAE